jgi:hypothetical protein
MKYLFAEPSHRPQFWAMIISGLIFVFVSFGFGGAEAMVSRIIFVAIGTAEVLMGAAEFFPREARRAAGIARISALGCVAIGIIALILLMADVTL